MDLKTQVMTELRPMIADVLAVEPDEVVPGARFFQDLGGEPIDMLDLAFKCERHFQVKAPFQQLGGPTGLPVESNGVLTSQAMDEVKRKFPFVDPSKVEEAIARGGVTELVTIDAIAELLVQAIRQQGESLPPLGETAPAAG